MSAVDACTRGWAYWRALGALQPSIDAAVLAVLESATHPDVVALAAAHSGLGWSQADELLARAHDALGLTVRTMTRDEGFAIVLREELLRHRSGSTNLRRVVGWAYETIGPGDPGDLCSGIVELESHLESLDYEPRRRRAVEERAQAEVDAFLARTDELIAVWRPDAER